MTMTCPHLTALAPVPSVGSERSGEDRRWRASRLAPPRWRDVIEGLVRVGREVRRAEQGRGGGAEPGGIRACDVHGGTAHVVRTVRRREPGGVAPIRDHAPRLLDRLTERDVLERAADRAALRDGDA